MDGIPLVNWITWGLTAVGFAVLIGLTVWKEKRSDFSKFEDANNKAHEKLEGEIDGIKNDITEIKEGVGFIRGFLARQFPDSP